MLLRRRLISIRDQQELARTLGQAGGSCLSYTPHLDFFRAEVRRAKGVSPEDVPGDMVTMNSRFAIRDYHTGETIACTLVYPGREAPQQGRLSVLSPIGMALFGARVGDEVCWQSSVGPEAAMVQRLFYQPEAAGHYHL